MIKGFWSTVALLAVASLLLMLLSGYLAGKVGVNPFPFLEHLKGK